MNNINNRMRIGKTAVLCLLLLAVSIDYINAQSRYNLSFQEIDSINFKWVSSTRLLLRTDSSALVNGKYPLVIEQKNDNHSPYVSLLKVDFQQSFLLPDTLENANIKISINNKCLNMEKLLLKVISLNKHQEIISTDSVDINNSEQWRKKTLTFGLKNAKFLVVGLDGYSPNFQDKPSKLYLDRISIELNNQDIEQISGIDYLESCKPMRLSKDIVVSDSLNADFINNIRLPDTRIIALGETVHGSSSITECVLNIIKENILNNNCRCVILEEDMSMLLKLNLYVSGKLPEKSKDDIEKDLSGIHFNKNTLLCFLSWLREYNQHTKGSKVRLWGMDSIFLYERNALFDYFYAFYDIKYNEVFYPILENIKSLNFKQAILDVTTQSGILENVMGKEEFEKFMYVLEFYKCCIDKGKSPIDSYLSLRNRDYYMFCNIDYFLMNHVDKDDKVFMYSHYGHAKKNAHIWVKFPDCYTAGYYLKKKYQDQYAVVGVTIGKGEITTRNNYDADKFHTFMLDCSSKSSLEAMYMMMNKKYVYNLTDYLPTSIYRIKSIGNRMLHKEEFYDAVKDGADAFTFIRDSLGFTVHEDETFDSFYIDKYIQRRRIMQQLQKDNNLIGNENNNKPL